MKLYYRYDKDADVLYFAQRKARATDISQEAPDDVVLRLDRRTKKVIGFTILNFTARMKRKHLPVLLPITADLALAR